MFRKREPATIVEDYDNATDRDKGIAQMAKKGYAVTNVAVSGGTVKNGRLLHTGGLGFFTPGGLKRGERYIVTFSTIA